MKQTIQFKSKKTVVLSEESREILDVAVKRGIQIPSENLGFFKSIYCELEEKNLNGIRLSTKAVLDALPGLIGSQVNFEHMGIIMGTNIDAWINDNNEVEVIYTMFKSIFPEEYEKSVELAKEGTLAISFELVADTDDQEQLSDGSVLLHKIDFTGTGHLMQNEPACPKAKIYEFASRTKARLSKINEKELMFASKIVEQCDKILKADRWSSDIYNNFPNSSFSIVEPAFLNGETGDIKARHLPFKDRNGRIDSTNYYIALDKVNEILPVTDSITKEELRKKAKEELDKHIDVFADKKETNQGGNTKVTDKEKAKIEEIRAELGDIVKDVSDDDLLDDAKVAELRTVKETKDAEVATIAADKKKKEIAYKVDSVEIRTFSLEDVDGVETIVESTERITVTDFNAMKASVDKVAELEASLEAKNSEIEVVRENAETIGKTKVQLSDNEFAKDFSDEDYLDEEKVANAIQDQENAKIVAERREEMKENEYVADFSDEDYLDETKVELAKTKKENDELKAAADKGEAKSDGEIAAEKEVTRLAKAKELGLPEDASQEDIDAKVVELAKAKKAKEVKTAKKVEMNAGKTVDDNENYETVMAKIRKGNSETKHKQTVYIRK